MSDVTFPANPRVVYDMPHRDYLAVEAMSASSVGHLLRSPQHFLSWSLEERSQTPAMALGELVHMGCLEPDRFKSKVYVWEKPADGKRLSPAERKERDEQHAAATLAGNLVVEKELYNTAARVIGAIGAHPRARRIIEGARTEVSLFWTDPRYGVPCKARYDILNEVGPLAGVLGDVKTTSDASPEAFARSAATYNYHAQAAMYWIAHEVCFARSPQTFVWIAAETEPPFGVAVYQIEQPALLVGMRLVNDAMRRYAEGLANNWPCYPQDVSVLKFPAWALRFRD